jgi:hypothetical protein
MSLKHTFAALTLALASACSSSPPPMQGSPATSQTPATAPVSTMRSDSASPAIPSAAATPNTASASPAASPTTPASASPPVPATPMSALPSGSVPAAPTPSAAACTVLQVCCASVVAPNDKQLCQAIANGGAPDVCDIAAADYCGPKSIGPATAAAPSGGDACSQLASCCSMLDDDDDQSDCQEAVDGAVAADCVDASDDYCDTPIASSGSPAGTANACTQLSACCVTLLSSAQTSCQVVAVGTDLVACSNSLTQLCPGFVPPRASAPATCADLMTCCSMLDDDDDQADCMTTASAGVVSDCQSSYDDLCGSGADD